MADSSGELNIAQAVETILAIGKVYDFLRMQEEVAKKLVELPDSVSPKSQRKRDQDFWEITQAYCMNKMVEENIIMMYLEKARLELLDLYFKQERYQKEKAAEETLQEQSLFEAKANAIYAWIKEQLALEIQRLKEAHQALQKLLKDKISAFKENFSRLIDEKFNLPGILNKDGKYEFKTGDQTLLIDPNRIKDIYKNSAYRCANQLEQGVQPNLREEKEMRRAQYYSVIREEAEKVGINVKDEEIEKVFERDEQLVKFGKSVEAEQDEICQLKHAESYMAKQIEVREEIRNANTSLSRMNATQVSYYVDSTKNSFNSITDFHTQIAAVLSQDPQIKTSLKSEGSRWFKWDFFGSKDRNKIAKDPSAKLSVDSSEKDKDDNLMNFLKPGI